MMAMSTQQNPTMRSFKLEHDITPRDIKDYDNSAEDILRDSNHRFRGYPVSNFESPRDPLTLDAKTALPPASPLFKHHGLPNFFDQQRPKYVFKEHKGLQYGSDGLPVNSQDPKPIRDPFHDKTSADLRKLRKQQEIRECDTKQFKDVKLQRMHTREQEKRRDLEMLKSYNPWGRPGAGAPLKSGEEHHKQKFTEEGLSPRYQPTQPSTMDNEYGGDFHGNFGRPGAGAPLRTDSGKLRTELKADEDIRFQDTQKGRRVNETELRYKQPPAEQNQYGKELGMSELPLDLQIRAKSLQAQQDRIQSMRKELEMLKHDPYGKPGAGAPNKTRSGMHVLIPKSTTFTPDYLELRRRQKRMTTSDAEQQGPSPEGIYNPWGKGVGQPAYDKYGDTRRYRFSDKDAGVITDKSSPDVGVSLPVGSDKPGGGAPVKTNSGNVKTRMPITMRRDERGEALINEERIPYSHFARESSETQVYDPWGKGGAGAPLKDSQGHVITNIYGKLKTERASGDQRQKALAAQEYLEELQREMEEQRRNRDCESRQQRAGAGDLAEVIKQGQVGRPRRDPNTGTLAAQHLGASDVTRLKTDQRQMKNENSSLYHTQLEEAAEARRRATQLDKLKDRQEGKHHQTAMNNLWGKPGAGAPNTVGTKKANLQNILFSPRSEASYYNKQYDNDAPPAHAHNYIRSTINSTHINRYENPREQRREPKKNYNLQAPWASEA